LVKKKKKNLKKKKKKSWEAEGGKTQRNHVGLMGLAHGNCRQGEV